MMTTEDILKEIGKEVNSMKESLRKIEDFQRMIESADMADWDWISVSQASRKFRLSPAFIYDRIKTKRISVKYHGSKMLVSESELKKLDDR